MIGSMDPSPPDRSGPAPPAAVAETHISVITMIGHRAYKLLKPVDTGFLDHREREARLRACRTETEANRRFAPDVYLGVLDVVDEDGKPRDHLIAMRRLPAERALSRLLDDAAAREHVGAVARAVAGLHREAPRSPAIDRAGRAEAMSGLWQEGLDQLAGVAEDLVEPGSVGRLRELAGRYIDGRGPLFARRIADGWIRDGHGDLLADDTYLLPEGPRVLDCLAFSERLRHGDVLADIATLAMDIETRGHPGLARALVQEWSAALGERHPRSLREHHIAYRAHVRAKVAALRADQGDDRARWRARALHRHSLTALQRAQVRLVLVGGAPGTGKSTVAARLAGLTGAHVLRSDLVRKELAGVAPGGRADAGWQEGLYTPAMTERVHAALRERAGELLELGEDVVLDASWSAAGHREDARALGRSLGAEVAEIRCTLDPAVAARRIQERRERGDDPSDATPALAARMAEAADPWPQAHPLATDDAPEPVAARAAGLAGLGASPA